jgi:8-oxo-dGTP pyrophosphatase MutT (NUDIX family)
LLLLPTPELHDRPMTSSSRRYELLQLLDRFDPEPGEERARAEMTLLVTDSGDPFSRYSFDPGHFTAGGCVLSPDGGSVLLVHHKRLDKWLQPGGHVDPEDTSVIAAAEREVVEETGVVLADTVPALLDIDIHQIPSGRGEPRHRHFDLRFLFCAARADLEPAQDEVNAADWVPFGEVAQLSTEVSLRRMVNKLAGRRDR